MEVGKADNISEPLLNHAWNWFELHANQRMTTLNFFLVSTAFLFAAYGTLLEKYRWAAVIVALLGAWLTLWFNRLDARTKELIRAGERALQACEGRLSQSTGLAEFEIVSAVERPNRLTPTYSIAFNWIEGSIGAIFLAGAVYAGLLAFRGADVHNVAHPAVRSASSVKSDGRDPRTRADSRLSRITPRPSHIPRP